MPAVSEKSPKIKSRAELVTRLIVVRTLRAELKAEDQLISEILLRSGSGEMFGTNGERILGISPSPKIVIQADRVPLLKEILSEKFDILIEQVKTWKPVEACRAIANRILTPLTLRKFLAKTEFESSPYIRIP